MNNHAVNLAALAALFADYGTNTPPPSLAVSHGDARRWRPGFGARHARGPLPASRRDPLVECQRFAGKTMRHRFTGQVRTVALWPHCVQFAQDSEHGFPRLFDREPRKALQWLWNAEAVA